MDVVDRKSPEFQSYLELYEKASLLELGRLAENAQTASTLGAIVFMFIAFRLFLAVEGAVNQIWKVRSARGYRQKIIAFTMLFFWGPLLMGLSFTTTSMLERNRYLRILFRGEPEVAVESGGMGFALLDLALHKFRSALATLGIIFGVASVEARSFSGAMRRR